MKVPNIHGALGNPLLRVLSCCLLAASLLLWLNLKTARAQSTPTAVDPGVRPGPQPPNGAGNPIAGLPSDQNIFWGLGLNLFGETASVKGTISGEPLFGLGPAFNGNSCLLCHSQPVIGGSSPTPNPQRAIANLDGATNQIPTFLTPNDLLLRLFPTCSVCRLRSSIAIAPSMPLVWIQSTQYEWLDL